MIKKFALIVGVACLATAFAATAQADIMLAPDADTTLSNDSNRGPTVNHGPASQNQVRWHEAPRVRIAYVRYDITGVDPLVFDTATLSGTFTDSGKNGNPGSVWNVYGLDDGVAGNDWDESSVNYSNAAGVDNAAALGTYSFVDSVLLGTLTLDGVDVQPLPFTSTTSDLDLSAFLAADTDGLVTIMMIDSAMTGVEYYIDSKEGNSADGHGPMTLNFIPEPSVAMLMLGGLGILSLARRRRR